MVAFSCPLSARRSLTRRASPAGVNILDDLLTELVLRVVLPADKVFSLRVINLKADRVTASRWDNRELRLLPLLLLLFSDLNSILVILLLCQEVLSWCRASVAAIARLRLRAGVGFFDHDVEGVTGGARQRQQSV
ncbi:hypothetical protein N7486_009659 [Penicillium sp. IBT 16267x]|nr:hypothetical protein N7486_009659 [Penicillium sp. IBT 16267x]